MKGYGNFNSGDFYGGSQFKISPEVSMTAVATVPAITVASGALVNRVGVWVTAAIISDAADIDIGYGDAAAIFFDGLGSLATNKVVWAPHGRGVIATHQSPLVEVEGLYFVHPDTIDVDVNTAASRGSIRVIAEMLDITEID